MTLHERADKLLALREDLYEMHFHKVDREWLIEAMVDFAKQFPQQEISYTGEQVMEAINMAREGRNRYSYNGSRLEYEFENSNDDIIQSLKQPKKD